MLLLLSCVIVLALAVVVYHWADLNGLEGINVFSALVIIISCFALAMILLTMPLNRYEVQSGLRQFRSVQMSIDTARANNSDIETAAVLHKIVESNQWLADVQFWNQTAFDLWIPDEVENLEPIR